MPAPFACDMTAIPPGERRAHHDLIRRLMSEVVEEIVELPDGLGFRFPEAEYESVARFLARERLCCPFLTFTLAIGPARGPLWLRLTGPEGAQEFIRAELHLPSAAR
jgi:hypothetical protein